MFREQKPEGIEVKAESDIKDNESGKDADMFFYLAVDRNYPLCDKYAAS